MGTAFKCAHPHSDMHAYTTLRIDAFFMYVIHVWCVHVHVCVLVETQWRRRCRPHATDSHVTTQPKGGPLPYTPHKSATGVLSCGGHRTSTVPVSQLDLPSSDPQLNRCYNMGPKSPPEPKSKIAVPKVTPPPNPLGLRPCPISIGCEEPTQETEADGA